MVSPLKTWQHDEPKHLWPVLGGLAVLIHIGILGLSLPYLIEMMQSAGGGSGLSDAPIELVFVDPAEPKATTSAASEAPRSVSFDVDSAGPKTSGTRAASNNLSSSQSTQAQITQTPAQPAQSQIQSQPEALSQARVDSDEGSRNSDTPTANPSAGADDSSQPADDSDVGNEGAQNESPPGDEVPTEDETADDEVSAGGAEEDVETGGADEKEGSGEEGSDELPTAPSDGALTAPTAGNGASTARATYLSIGNPQEVPEDFRRDVTDTPPRPKSESLANSILLSLDGLGCGTVDFSQSGDTYKLFISDEGQVIAATLWTDGQVTGREGEEDAITCLIENAGFEFEPATLNGEAVQNDNLLVTVQVDEATGE